MSQDVSCVLHDIISTTAGKESPPGNEKGKASATTQLFQEGFSDKQASRILSYLSARRLSFRIMNVKHWLHLLHQCHVVRPNDAISQHPIILEKKAATMQAKAAATVLWISKNGLTDIEIGELLCKRPEMLNVTLANLEAVDAWLSSKLSWTADRIGKVLARCPQLFSLTPVNLSSKLAWFNSQGLSNSRLSTALFHTPTLFDCTIIRNETQLSALQAAGLTHAQVAHMLYQVPQLLTRDMSGDVIQAKFRFLGEVMGQDVQKLVQFPAFLTCSLSKRIGPRWAFHNLHCPGQQFTLGYNLTPKDQDWLQHRCFATLAAECSRSGVTLLHMYSDFSIQWRQEEGARWNFENSKHSTQKADVSVEGPAK